MASFAASDSSHPLHVFSPLSYYPLLKSHCAPTTFIPFPPHFARYLTSDGTLPPDDCVTDDVDDDVSWGSDDNDGIPSAPSSAPVSSGYAFPALTAQLTAIITKYHSILPKTTWSAPLDATWMNGNSLRCFTPTEVYLLLKSSDFIQHDLSLNHPTPTLVLRKWLDIPAGVEFRCFIKNRRLFAVSQRDVATFYPYLVTGAVDEYVLQLEKFVKNVLARGFGEEDYVADLYIYSSSTVKIVDLNPYDDTTDPGLYTYTELNSLALTGSPDVVSVRVVESEKSVRSGVMGGYRAPIDTVELFSGKVQGGWDKFRGMCLKGGAGSESSGEEEEGGEGSTSVTGGEEYARLLGNVCRKEDAVSNTGVSVEMEDEKGNVVVSLDDAKVTRVDKGEFRVQG